MDAILWNMERLVTPEEEQHLRDIAGDKAVNEYLAHKRREREGREKRYAP